MALQNPNIPGVPEPTAVSENLPAGEAESHNRLDPEDVSLAGTLGQATQNAGQLADKVFAQKQQIADKAKNDAQATSILQGDADVQVASNNLQNNFKALSGGDAHDAFEDTMDQFDKAAAKVKSSLPQETQDKFANRIALHRDTFEIGLQNHMAEQNRVMKANAEKASDAAATTGIANAAAGLDTDMADQLIHRQLHMVAVANAGQPQAVQVQAQQAAIQKYTDLVVGQLVAQAKGDDPVGSQSALTKAEQYLEQHRDDLGAKQAKDYLAVVKATKSSAGAEIQAQQDLIGKLDPATGERAGGIIDPVTGQSDPEKLRQKINASTDKNYIESLTRRAAMNDKQVQDTNSRASGSLLSFGSLVPTGNKNPDGTPEMREAPFSLARIRSDGSASQLLNQLTMRDGKAAESLEALDHRELTIQAAEANLANRQAAQQFKEESGGALRKAWTDLGDNASQYKADGITEDQYRSRLIRGDFGQMTTPDINQAMDVFRREMKGEQAKPSATAMNGALNSAGLKKQAQKDPYQQILMEAADKFAKANAASKNPKQMDDGAWRSFFDDELKMVKVHGGGWFGSDTSARRIDYEIKSQPGGDFEGKTTEEIAGAPTGIDQHLAAHPGAPKSSSQPAAKTEDPTAPIPVRAPNGKIHMIPQEHLDDAIKAGGVDARARKPDTTRADGAHVDASAAKTLAEPDPLGINDKLDLTPIPIPPKKAAKVEEPPEPIDNPSDYVKSKAKEINTKAEWDALPEGAPYKVKGGSDFHYAEHSGWSSDQLAWWRKHESEKEKK